MVVVAVAVTVTVGAALGVGTEAGLLAQLAHGGCLERLAGLLSARHGLPMLRIISALEQQDAQVRRIDDHQRRDRKLVAQPHPAPGTLRPRASDTPSPDEYPERLVPLLPIL